MDMKKEVNMEELKIKKKQEIKIAADSKK